MLRSNSPLENTGRGKKRAKPPFAPATSDIQDVTRFTAYTFYLAYLAMFIDSLDRTFKQEKVKEYFLGAYDDMMHQIFRQMVESKTPTNIVEEIIGVHQMFMELAEEGVTDAREAATKMANFVMGQ